MRYILLLAIMLVIVGCGAPIPTPTSTPVPTPTATAAPAPPAPAPTATPTPTIAPTSTPTHAPTTTQQAIIDPGPGTEYIGPHLWALLQRQANGEDGLPSPLRIRLIDDITDEAALETAIEEAGGTAQGDGVWEIPTAKALAIIQRPDVYYADIVPVGQTDEAADPQLNETLADIASAYANGISAEQAAQYALFIRNGSVAVEVAIADASTEAEVLAWLSERDIYAPPVPGDRTDYDIAVLLPVGQIRPLAQAFPAVWLYAESHLGQGLPLTRARWPAEVTAFEDEVVGWLLKPADGGEQ